MTERSAEPGWRPDDGGPQSDSMPHLFPALSLLFRIPPQTRGNIRVRVQCRAAARSHQVLLSQVLLGNRRNTEKRSNLQ